MLVQQSFQQSSFSASSFCHVADTVQAGRYHRLVKRPLDCLLVTMASPFIIPLIFVLALLVMFDGGRPFYSQLRVGRGGRTYRMWKLRSMVVDADDRLRSRLETDPAARDEWDRTQKLRNDPRVTPFGRFLRACSMDELPQLWNVLRGDMSLIGPRPMLPEQQEIYPGSAYYRMRPGLTGLWQISARNSSSFAARAAYDDLYEQQFSMAQDIRILMHTVSVVLRRTGC